MTETRSTCPYCGVGCGVIIESDGARITGVRGDPDHPANAGRLCTKGSTLHLTADPVRARQVRLLQPLYRATRGAAPQPLGWDAALDLAAGRLTTVVRDNGPDALGFYLSGQLLTEDYYAFNKLVKGLLGSNEIDTNSRLCMSSAVAAYKLTLGADAPPACYEDIDHAHCLFIAGSNTAWAHPILFRRIEAARARNPALRLIVADPRRTETAAVADLHLPLRPGTDVRLAQGLLHIMLREGWVRRDYIEAHTRGFDALEAQVRGATPERVAADCGLPPQDLLVAARWFATSQATLSLYCQGMNQSANGTAKNAHLIHLHLATAQIGRPGAGPFSLTGQPNAMGGREVGGMANLLSAHRDLANPAHRAEVAALWGVPEVPATPGRTAVEMFQAAADGEVRALWIACTNPAQSLPDQAMVRRALQRAEFVVVQETFATSETCAFADLLLPATTWGEKDGTVTNSERRISRMRAAVPPPHLTPDTAPRPDWLIARDLGRRLEARLNPGRPTLFPWDTPEAVWNEHRETTRGRDLDVTGLSYARLEQLGPQQWPCPADQAAAALAAGATQLGRARLYTEGRFCTPDGRARFADLPWSPVAEPCESTYPLALTTGRLRDQWHGMTRTGTLGRLFGHSPEPSVQLHPDDLARLGLAAGALARVRSRRGELVLPAQADPGLPPGQAFIAMHWGAASLGGRAANGHPLAGINQLTNPAFCPHSHQPELKHAAVSIEPARLPWTLRAAAWLAPGQLLTTREALCQSLGALAFFSCVPFGREREGLLLQAAHPAAPPRTLIDEWSRLLNLGASDVLRYDDALRGVLRALRLGTAQDGHRLQAMLLAGDTRPADWLLACLQDDAPVPSEARLLLAPRAAPRLGPHPSRGRQVCACLDVREDVIRQFLGTASGSADERLTQLQANLRCGTQCGSCVPQLRDLARASASTTAPCPPVALIGGP